MASPAPAPFYSVFEQGDATITLYRNGNMKICAKNDKHVGSQGMWNGDNPLQFVLPITLVQLILAIAASQLFYVLLRPLRTPKFVCSVLVSSFRATSPFLFSWCLVFTDINFFFLLRLYHIIYRVALSWGLQFLEAGLVHTCILYIRRDKLSF